MNHFSNRQKNLLDTLTQFELDAVAINPGPSLVYLTGLHFHLMERPVVAFFTPGRPVYIVLPELERIKLADLPYPLEAFAYNDDPASWSTAFQQAVAAARLENHRIGVEPTRLRFLELRFLEAAAPQAAFVSAEGPLAALRMRKDAAEVGAMRKAVEIAQNALLATLPMVKAGVTERQVASELVVQLLRAGSESEMPFAPIIASGPNSANPHATPTDRRLAPGDLLIVDWGASYEGYISDLTRTFAIQSASSEFEQIARIVAEANAAGRATAGPEISAGSVDQATRAVIEKAGYGPYFTHRTGHGIGMEGHEAPYIYGANELTLLPGMAFTVEPGIYLPGRGGVRIEDNLVISGQGSECLSDLPCELRIIG